MAFNWKKIIWPITAMLALIGFFFNKGPKWRARAEEAQDEATAAKVDALEAMADLEKEKINNEAQQKLDDLAAMSDDELAAAVTAEYNNRPGAEAGGHLEDPPADREDHSP